LNFKQKTSEMTSPTSICPWVALVWLCCITNTPKVSLIPLAITSCGMVCCACAVEPPFKKPLVPFEFQTNGIINGISNTDMSMGGLGVVVLHHKHTKASLIPLAITSCGMVCCACAVSHRLKNVEAV